MRIGIIGSGGAGICAAWLLDQDHDITILEKKKYEGGDTHTVHTHVHGSSYAVDDGAAWFSPTIYPYFNRYLDLTGVAYDWLPGSLTFYDPMRGRTTLLPPVEWRRITPIFTRLHVLPQFLAFAWVMHAAGPYIEQQNTQITFGEFMKGLHIPEGIREHFIKPLLAGVWGAPHGEADNFALYPLMKYIIYHKPTGLKYFNWKVMRGGTEAYIKTVSALFTRTEIRLDDGVTSITPHTDGSMVQVIMDSGRVLEFDRLIITSGPQDVRPMIAGAESLRSMHDALLPFQSYKAILATHSDPSYMPPQRSDWSIVNVTYDGHESHATVWHGFVQGVDLFCSYIDQGETPQNLHHISEWWLPSETPEFFRAQRDLVPLQGLHNIWLGGAYTQDIGSHESAIVSAIRAVEAFSPQSARLRALKQKTI